MEIKCSDKDRVSPILTTPSSPYLYYALFTKITRGNNSDNFKNLFRDKEF